MHLLGESALVRIQPRVHLLINQKLKNMEIPINRDIYFDSGTDLDKCGQLYKEIINAKKEALKLENIPGYKVTIPPLTLHLTSPGGSVYYGLGLYDVIRSAHMNIIAKGLVSSMGVIILLAGKLRLSYENTLFLIHQPSSVSVGEVQFMEEDVEIMKQIRSNLFDIITTRSKISREQLDDITKRKFDWWVNAKEALELGLIHDIIK